MKVLPDFNVFDFSIADLTSGKEVEMFTEECSDSELIKWDACGRPLYKMGWFLMEKAPFFFLKLLNSLHCPKPLATKTWLPEPQGDVYRVLLKLAKACGRL